MRVIWAPVALRDIERIYDYLVEFNPQAAADIAIRLLAAGNALEYFPERGRPIGGGRREQPLIWPYVIRYRVNGDVVQILRVRHGRRQTVR